MAIELRWLASAAASSAARVPKAHARRRAARRRRGGRGDRPAMPKGWQTIWRRLPSTADAFFEHAIPLSTSVSLRRRSWQRWSLSKAVGPNGQPSAARGSLGGSRRFMPRFCKPTPTHSKSSSCARVRSAAMGGPRSRADSGIRTADRARADRRGGRRDPCPSSVGRRRVGLSAV